MGVMDKHQDQSCELILEAARILALTPSLDRLSPRIHSCFPLRVWHALVSPAEQSVDCPNIVKHCASSPGFELPLGQRLGFRVVNTYHGGNKDKIGA